MKRKKLSLAGLIAVIIAFPVFNVSANASSYSFKDNYWGYKDNGYGDIIASSQNKYAFSIGSLTSSYGPSGLSVTVKGSYFDQSAGNKLRTTMGDLFISTNGWKPFNKPSTTSDDSNLKFDGWYRNDNSYTNKGEDWEYVFALDDRTFNNNNSDSGSFSVYRLPATDVINSINLTEATGTWRNYQEWKVKDSWAAGQQALATGTWLRQKVGSSSNTAYENNESYLRFDLATLDFMKPAELSAQNWGYHWAMSCGNDTIEGSTPNPVVPEPSTLVLLGVGIIATGLLRKRYRR